MEVSEKTYQILLEIMDRLEQPNDTSQAGILDLRQFFTEFDAKQFQPNVETEN